MIYYLQIGQRTPFPARSSQQLPSGLAEWVLPVMMNAYPATLFKQQFDLPLLPATYPEPYYGNARAYRSVHLVLLASHAGIDELLFDQGGYGLLATTPDLVVLRPEHAQELAAALRSWVEAHPLATPEYAGPDWPASEPEPPIEHQVLDLLLWLTFWTMYALDQYREAPQAPVIGNFDWQYHPLASIY
jgi:hypothetical protein